jgi:hypothetical protein
MPLIRYIEKNFRQASLDLIKKCNAILRRYTAAGYDMTLRQLYYQLVAADEIPNNPRSYDNLGALVNDARLAGLIDWDFLVDRTRELQSVGHWESPGSIMDAVAGQYRIDKWETQKFRPEVWIEKEALAGVFERVCNRLDVPFFSCRGYTSQSEMWRAGRRLATYVRRGQTPVIFHFGDHDPSGMDMTRDIDDRLKMFMGGLDINRLALNMAQIEEFQPPPNPAKISDSRAANYIELYGDESWELDALEPDTLAGLVTDAIAGIRDEDEWQLKVAEENDQRATLRAVSENFDEIQDFARAQGWLEAAEDSDDDEE